MSSRERESRASVSSSVGCVHEKARSVNDLFRSMTQFAIGDLDGRSFKLLTLGLLKCLLLPDLVAAVVARPSNLHSS